MPWLALALTRSVLALLCVAVVPADLHGQEPAFACTPSIDFGTVAPGQFIISNMSCTNTQTVPVAFSYGGTTGREDFEPNPCVGGLCYDTFPRVVSPGDSFGIVVAFHPTALGRRFGSQTILNNVGLPNSVTYFTGVGGSVQIPTLSRAAKLMLATSLSLVAIFIILNGGRRVA